MDFVPSDRATPIRQPSTANLMIDSADRNPSFILPNDFSITKTNSILNGFFTRIGTTEVVLDWFSPNISPGDATDSFVAEVVSGATPGAYTFNAPIGFYTQAQLVKWVVAKLNSIPGGITWTVVTTLSVGSSVALVPSANITIGFNGSIAQKLKIDTPPVAFTSADGVLVGPADLRLYSYIDFVSQQLTYAQDVKDASTAKIVRDVLCRWYFAFDQPPTFDEYGFPILMGYTPFCLRRLFSPPKQIKWEANLPVGNLSFQTYDPYGNLALMNYQTNYQMTLQASEV